MTEISFYQLTKTPLNKALPQLLEKILSSGNRAVLIAKKEENLKDIDTFLWSYSTIRVVPHGTKEDGYSEEQPVYLTLNEENPNNSDVLVMTGGSEPNFIKSFSRCLDIFDGNNEEELSMARERWKKYSNSNEDLTLSYWKQNEKGSWEKSQ